jgi:uncharacterized membrane protein YiaA
MSQSTPAASPRPPAGRPTNAFVGASWASLVLGGSAFLIGLWNAQMTLSEKGYYLTILMYGLFAAVSVQKSVRDRMEGVPVSGIYFGLSWVSVAAALVLLAVGLWNAGLTLSEKGFYAMAFTLSLFSAVTVQKNVRDLAAAEQPPTGAGPDDTGVQWVASAPFRD